MMHDTIQSKYVKETNGDMDIIIPESGFLHDYYNYAVDLTEAPPLYHLFVGMSLVSAVLGRNVKFPFGASTIYPNLWIVLLAQSSLYKKSTAISIGRAILRDVDEDIVLPNEFSSELLVTMLSKSPSGIFCWSEFAGPLASFNRKYMAGTKEMLTDLYDCPPIYKRKLKSDEQIIKDACISILTASAMEWLRAQVRETDVMSGFLARFIFVPASERADLKPIPPIPNKDEREHLIESLLKIGQIERTMELSKEARFMHDTWYRQSDKGMQQEDDIELLSPFYTRLNTYLLKFAMIYQVADNDSSLISPENLHKAILLVDRLKSDVKKMLINDIVLNARDLKLKKVELIIRKKGAVSRTDLIRKSRTYKRELDEIIDTLCECNLIAHDKGDNGATFYTWKGAK